MWVGHRRWVGIGWRVWAENWYGWGMVGGQVGRQQAGRVWAGIGGKGLGQAHLEDVSQGHGAVGEAVHEECLQQALHVVK